MSVGDDVHANALVLDAHTDTLQRLVMDGVDLSVRSSGDPLVERAAFRDRLPVRQRHRRHRRGLFGPDDGRPHGPPAEPLVVVVGDTHSEWRLDAGVALLPADDEAEIVIATAAGRSDEGRSAVEHLRPDDAIIAPAHVLHDLAPRAGWRVIRKPEDANLIVVGGPHRLSTSRGVTRRTFAATSTRPTVEPA